MKEHLQAWGAFCANVAITAWAAIGSGFGMNILLSITWAIFFLSCFYLGSDFRTKYRENGKGRLIPIAVIVIHRVARFIVLAGSGHFITAFAFCLSVLFVSFGMAEAKKMSKTGEGS